MSDAADDRDMSRLLRQHRHGPVVATAPRADQSRVAARNIVSTLRLVSAELSPRAVFHQLRCYTGPNAYGAVLRPWVEDRGGWLRDLMAPLASYGAWRRDTYVFGDLLEQAYALSRVSDVLLLSFQPPLPAGVRRPWAHELHLATSWPQVAVDQYIDVFSRLGMSPIEARAFDPFFHEIVAVEQAADTDHPVEIVDSVWPGLMFGELLFSRSGVRVRAGVRHAVAGIADRSTLCQVFLRRHRDTSDGSLGWGHNSQWKTDFRRDYMTHDAQHFNVDGQIDVAGLTDRTGSPSDAEIRDLVRHRCLVRHTANDEEPPFIADCRLTVRCADYPTS
jgi:hypothetical protein